MADHARSLKPATTKGRFSLLGQVGVAGNLSTDAHPAARTMEYQAELVSTDVDFARFPGLRWFNPLRLREKERH